MCAAVRETLLVRLDWSEIRGCGRLCCGALIELLYSLLISGALRLCPSFPSGRLLIGRRSSMAATIWSRSKVRDQSRLSRQQLYLGGSRLFLGFKFSSLDNKSFIWALLSFKKIINWKKKWRRVAVPARILRVRPSDHPSSLLGSPSKASFRGHPAELPISRLASITLNLHGRLRTDGKAGFLSQPKRNL